MKTIRKFAIFITLSFFGMQFASVAVFNQLLKISEKNNLAVEDLAKYQTWIMNTVFGFLILFGILFLSFMMALVWRAWTDQEEGVNAKSASS
jgi:hypothetical protein